MWTLMLLGCGGAPTPDAYAVGVEMLVERVLIRARGRAWEPGCWETLPDPDALRDRVAGEHPLVPAPGFTSPDDRWAGRVEVSLAVTDDPLAWGLAMAWTDVEVRHGIDRDPIDYTFAGALSGTLRVEATGHEASCRGLLAELSADVTGALDATADDAGVDVDLHVWSSSYEYSGGGGATGTVAGTDVNLSWEWYD